MSGVGCRWSGDGCLVFDVDPSFKSIHYEFTHYNV